MRTRWQLVGRDHELDRLEAGLTGPEGTSAVVSGQQGVGKTRLAAELLERVAGRGWTTAWVAATPATAGVAFGAFAALLPTTVAAAASPLDVMRQACAELRQDRPLVLAVDDAHLLDDASVVLTHLLVSTGTARVVATVRRDEPVPEPLAVLEKDGLASVVELEPLSRPQVGELLASALGGPLDAATGHRLWQVTRGNALFLHELTLAGLERGTLAERGGSWSWVGELAGAERLTEVVEQRLADLDRPEREAMEILAVGEPLGPRLLATVDPPVLESLAQRGLVTVAHQRRRTVLRLAHPLYSDALRTRMTSLRRRDIHRQLADTLADTGARRRDDVLRLATWRLDGGGAAEPALLVAAARKARALFDHRLAERLARAAQEAGGGRESGVLLADALHWQGRPADAKTVLERLPAEPQQPAAEVAWEAVVTASNWFWGLGKPVAAFQTLLDAQQALGPGAEADELTAHRALLLTFNGRPDDALTAAEPLLAGRAVQDRARVRALAAATPAWALRGMTDRAVEAAADGLGMAAQFSEDEPWLRGSVLAGQSIGYLFAGRFTEVEQLAGAGYRDAQARHADDLRGLWALLLGRVALARGKASTALDRLREATELLRGHDVVGFLSWALACRANAAAVTGARAEAAEALAEAEQRRVMSFQANESELMVARAWVAVGEGQRSSAQRLTAEAAAFAADRGQRMLEAMALHEGLRLGVRVGMDRLTQLDSLVDGLLAPAFAAHGAALAADDGRALDRAAERFAELGALLLAAETAAEAAESHGRAGEHGLRRSSLERCRCLARDCEGATTPMLRAVGQAPQLAWLTSREREVAELAGAGLSNREIAARLDLSIRTVGNHLNHVYSKLSVSGRAELAMVLELQPHT